MNMSTEDSSRYVGTVVIAERIVPTKEYSTYKDGRYLITDATNHALYGHTLDGGHSIGDPYGLHIGPEQLPLSGDAAFRITTGTVSTQHVLSRLAQSEEEINQVEDGKKKATWNSSVYATAKARIRELRELLTEPTNIVPDDDELLTGGTIVATGSYFGCAEADSTEPDELRIAVVVNGRERAAIVVHP